MDVLTTLALACWAIFLIVMVAAALFTKRTSVRQSLASRAAYGVPLVIAFLLFLEGMSTLQVPFVRIRTPVYPLYVPVLPHTISIAGVGLLLTIAGLLLVLWARAILGTNWSGSVTLKEDHELVERGPYGYVRHPIYSGVLLMFLGTAVVVGTLGGLLGFPFLLVSCWIKLRQEESLLQDYFGREYSDYMTRVKALVPFVV